MESMIKAWLVMPILFLSATYLQQCVNGKSQVPCLFIFGDSLSDSGNNNNLATSSKCNYNPYGIDFPFGPTGRFTNGRTTIDIISKHSFNVNYIIINSYRSFLLRSPFGCSSTSWVRGIHSTVCQH
jgi:hypothetical protein